MKSKKFFIVSMVLLTIIVMGAVNAAEDYNSTAADVVVDAGEVELDSPVVDEIDAGGDIGLDDSPSVDESVIDDTAIGTDEKQVEKLGASNEDALGDDYEIIDVAKFHEKGFDTGTVYTGIYKMEGTFDANNDNFPSFIIFDSGCVVDASDAEFIDIGIILHGDVQLSGLTITSTKYLEDMDNDLSPGAIVYVEGDDNILDGLTVNYAPTADGSAYGIYVIEASNFQLLNSNIEFTGSSLEDYYEYAMRITDSSDVLIQGNTIIANLPILDVDYNMGDPGLATDLVLNTGLREIDGLDIIDNTFIANVIDRNGGYPTLDCVMMEYCDNVNVVNNKFRETDFITNEGDPNYLNVLDMYYSNNVLVQGNNISVETTGGTDDAGTSYPIQLTGPYEGVVIDGNDLYANCGGPALGIYSQNYYGDTEITVQNNNIDVTGLPTDHSWGLVSGVELQDNVARVYNNTITTKSITGSFEEGMNLYGISYAQALMDGHNYDIWGNTIETEGQYTIYLLQAEDTTITDNYLVSSTGEGDDTVYIREASGNTVIENNHGAKEEPETFYGVVTVETFFDFFKRSGVLKDDIPAGATLDFQGQFISTSSTSYAMEINKPVNIISTTKDVYIDLDATSSNRFTVSINGSGSNISDLSFYNTQLWFYDAHNLIIDNMTSIARGKDLGSGVGVVAFRGGSSNIKVKNSYFLTEDNGGHSNFVLTNASYVSMDNCSIIGHGNVGNLIYLNAYNLETMPEGWFMPQLIQAINKGQITLNDHNNFTNCYIEGPETALGICYIFTNMGSGFNIFENNTVVYSGAGIYSFGNDGIIRGNTFIGGCGIASPGARTQIIDNNLTTTVTISAGGENIITRNTVITTSNYAVDLGKTKGNTVSDNYLVSNGKKGDAAVNLGTGTGNAVQDNLPVDIILSVQNSTIWLGEENSVTVTIAGAGEVTIKLNGVVIATPTLTSGTVSQTISASDIVLGENTVEVTYRGLTNSTTFNAEENVVEPSNIVTQDNFFEFFDDEGNLLDTVEFDELIFQGEFENLVDYITLSEGLSIVGDEATLYNIGFIFDGDDIKLDNLKLVADEPLGALISALGVYNIIISNLDITYDGGNEMAVVIDIEGDDVKVLNNTIFFESHVTSDVEFAAGLKITGSTDVLVDGNSITARLPCVYCDNYDDDYYMMGSDKVDPVRLKDCYNLVFTNNYINSTTNDYSADFPTIQAIQIIGCHDSILDHNNISMIDEMTPAGMDNYLYGINFGYNTNVTFSNNNFNMSTSGGKVAAGTAYAFQGVESEVLIKGNNITSISNGPNLGIYVASMFGGDSDLIIEGNFINVTGYADVSHNWALVSGIEIQNGDAKIYNNTIYTYNVNEYENGTYIYGISYAQWMYGDRSFDIQDNEVHTDGQYTISIIDATSLNAERNILYGRELAGDDSIDPGLCQDVTLADNFPPCLTNIVTQDNFYDFFDESGILKDTLSFDELIFQGEFADLGAGYVIITKPVTITGDNAVLNNIGIVVSSNDVTLSDLTLNADTALGDLVYVGESNVNLTNINITYIVDDEAARAISIIGASDVNVENAKITFESHLTDSSIDACAINIEDSENVAVTESEINSSLPALYVDYMAATTQFMGLDKVNPIRVVQSSNINITRNVINSKTNDYSQEYATIQAIAVLESEDCLIDSNNITLTDEFAQAGQDIYLYGISFAYDEGLVMSNNNFTVYTEGGMENAGTAYAIQGIESKLSIIGNNITTFSNGPNLGIYVTSMAGETSTMLIENNFINVTGLACSGNNWALVSGIEIQNGDAQIYNNTIYTYNVADYNEDDYLSGISYIQYMYGGRTFDIQDNTVYTEGKYAIYLLDASNSVITGNTLYGHDLTGDDAVYIQSGDNNIVQDNLPKDEIIKEDSSVVIYPFSGAVYGEEIFLTYDVEHETVVSVVVEDADGNVITDGVDTSVAGEVTIAGLVPGDYIITITNEESELYYGSSDGAEFTVDKADVTIDVVADDITYGEDVVVTVTGSVDGDYTVTVNGVTKDVALVANEAASVNFGALDVDTYAITANYAETANYNAAVNDTETVTVGKVPTEIIIANDTLMLNVGDEVDSGASLTPVDAGDLTFTSSDDTVAIVEDGKIKALAEGTAVITVSFAGDDKYAAAEDKTITVNTAGMFIVGYDVNMIYEDGSAYMVQLVDKSGAPVAQANEAINITINGRTYTRLTNENGIAKLTIHLNASKYDVTAQYGNCIINNVVTVNMLPIVGYDVNMTYEDGSAYMVQLVDVNGNPFAKSNEAINITINGRTYTRYTNASGIAKVTIHLNASTYDVTAQYGNTIIHNTVTVHALPIVASDVNMVYKDGSAYIVQLVDKNGNPFAKSNQAISITIAGKTYTRYTNASGAAKITINLAAGTYNVTAQYGDTIVNNVVTVNRYGLVASDVNMTYKDGSVYMVQLVDGQGNPVAKENMAVNITIDGRTYSRVTDANGVAKVTINLRAGEYPVTAQKDNVIIENVVTVNNNFSISASDLVMTYKDGSAFEVQLVDENGNPCALANEPVKITIAGKTYTRSTNENGVARIVINLAAGTYPVTTEYNNKTLSNTITVNKA